MSTIVIPYLKAESFNCPHCHALSQQYWYDVHTDYKPKRDLNFWTDENTLTFLEEERENIPDEIVALFERRKSDDIFISNYDTRADGCLVNIYVSKCYFCENITIWHRNKILYPEEFGAEEPNSDMPPEIKKDYNEARAVLKYSPKASAALLRLCIQKLCNHLNASGDNLNKQIGELVKKGLDNKIQKALDAVRVIGNEAVHPGTINLDDNKQIAYALFKLVNQIVEQLITNEREIDEIYELLPESARKSIEKRDSK